MCLRTEWLLAGVALAIAAAGCTKRNPDFCEAASECESGFTCDLSSNTCVPDELADAAPGTPDGPVADADPNAPDADFGCSEHTDCTTGICDTEAGTCLPAAQVIYLAPDGIDVGECTDDAPCIKLSYAVTKLTSTRKSIVLAPGSYTDETTGVVIDGKDALIVGYEANYALSADPSYGLIAMSGTTLELEGLTVYEPARAICVHIENGAVVTLDRVTVTSCNRGVNGAASSKAAVRRSTITDTKHAIYTYGELELYESLLSTNETALQLVNGPHKVENNMIVDNTSISGYSTIAFYDASGGTFAFNTISGNTHDLGDSSIVNCDDDTVLSAENNIIYDNTANRSVLGPCTWRYSNIEGRAAAGVPSAPGNIDLAPLFVNAAAGNYHIQAGSPARNAADPAATTYVDFDGDARPAGGRADIGADEIP